MALAANRNVGLSRNGGDEMQDIFWGAVIISIGLLMGGSVFLGDFDPVSIFFDALGVFFIGKGAISLTKEGSSA